MAKYFEFIGGFFMVATLFLSIQTTEANCNTTNNFGANCSFRCHCLNNEQCDFTTGECSSGCDFEWVGPACQHRNIILVRFNAAGKRDESRVLVRHSSNIYPYRYAFRAHDKSLSTCSYTADASKSTDYPWWKVWLEITHKITKIEFITKFDTLDYFRGFNVLVSNVSYANRDRRSFFNEKTCFTHSDIAPDSKFVVVTCNKPMIGNHIRIQLAREKAQLVLCDVRVYGECQDKTYGDRCTKRCSSYCEDICNKDNGECISCVTGWMGRRCDRSTCDDQHFGINCTEMCSPNCVDICNEGNGTCSTCKPGWTGSQCRQECTAGFFGEKCKQNCSIYCVKEENFCNNENGTCLSGCLAGWDGPLCNQECEDGKYGTNCAFLCSGNCKDNSACNKVNGTCVLGCKAGYLEHNCSTICKDRTYGKDCSFHCSRNCLNGTECLHTNGSCLNGCEPGWTGDLCNNACPIGMYGDDCALNCSIYCLNGSVCLHTNGSCIEGCDPGWIGDTCHNECQNKTYGQDCSSNCSLHCLNGSECVHTDGSCVYGCDPGWTGTTCDDTCTLGYYGPDCRKKCSSYCVGGYANCDPLYGSCMSGCKAGWMGRGCDEVCEDGTYGIKCSDICSENCKDACDKVNGKCTSCHSGWYGEVCMLACTAGQWGENCAHRCVNCHNETCNRFNGACNGLCKPGFKQTKYCDQECNPGFYGMNCSKICSPYCKDVAYCKYSDGSCFECVDGWEGFYCEKESEQSGCISNGELAGLISSFVFVVVIFLIVLSTDLIRRKLRGGKHVSQEATVSYMNTLFTAHDNSANIYETVAGKHDSKTAYESLSD